MSSSPAPFLGFGVGLRPVHYNYLLENRTRISEQSEREGGQGGKTPSSGRGQTAATALKNLPAEGATRAPMIDWLEILSENYMMAGGRPLAVLMKLREAYPVVMHGVSLSIGTTDPLNTDYLQKLKRLAERVQPAWVSDHLCWTGFGGHNAHDLLPLPYTEEAIRHVVGRIRQVQDFLGRRIALENVSSYIEYRHSTLPEWEFLATVAQQADCGILLDVNNIFVSSVNHRFDPVTYIRQIPPDRVWQYHLAGHSDTGDYLLDTHDHPVVDKVWELYAETVGQIGLKSTLLEWDDHIPEFPVLEAEIATARKWARKHA